MSTATMPPSALLGRRERLWPTVVVSLALHAAFIAAAAWRKPPALVDLNQKPLVAKLVRLGEVRPKQLLPRKDAAPPPGPVAAPAPAPPPPKVATAPRPDAMPPPKAQPSKPAVAAPGPRPRATPAPAGGGLASVMSRIQKEKVYGSPEGDPRGDAEQGEAGDLYLAQVTRALQDTYTLPSTLSEKERMHLRATVILFIEPDGRIARYQFETRSGNQVFDTALERAVQSARLPPPPAEARARYRSEGLAVLYRP